MVEYEEHVTKVLSNLMVDLRYYLPDVDPKSIGVTEDVYYPLLKQILDENESEEDIIEEIQYNISELIPKHITKEDIFASINYNIHLEYGIGNDDDIDHLGSTVSVCRVWNVLFVRECPHRIFPLSQHSL